MTSKLKLIPLYLLLISTLGSAAISKFYEGSVPSWFKDQFQGTPIDYFRGSLASSYFLIALLEAASSSLLLASLIRREFLPLRDRKFLHLGLLLTQFTFVALAFGQRLTHKYHEAFELFAYAVLVFLVQQALHRKEPILT